MVGTWTYDPATNTLTVTGGTSSSPTSFIDAWNADKAGTRTNLTATAVPLAAISPTAQVKAADSLELILTLTVTNFVTAGNVIIVGTDGQGTTITTTNPIQATGSYLTNLYFASITSITADGDYTLQITQPRWGIIWKQSGIQYQLDYLLKIGDGSTATHFTDSAKSIIWSNFMAYGAVVLTVKAAAYFTAGALLNESNKTTCNGLHFYILNTNAQRVWMQFESGSNAYLYSCTFEEASNADFYLAYYPKRIWNCNLHMAIFRYLSNADLFNVQFWQVGNNGCFQNSYAGNTMDKLCAYSCSSITKTDGTGQPTLRNLYARNNSAIVTWNNNPLGAAAYLVNPDVDSYSFIWAGNASTVYRQYEFDLTTEPNAVVTLTRVDGTTVFSLTADASTGAIETQTVTKGYYNSANGNSLQDYGPFTLRISKAGKMSYTDSNILLTSKTALHIQLHDQLIGNATSADVKQGVTFYGADADVKLTGSSVSPAVFVDVVSGKPVLNLNRCKLDNQLVLSLG